VQPVPREVVTPFAPRCSREAEEQRGLFLAEQRAKTMTGNSNTATDFRNTILNGDSVQLMRALPRNAVDFILTDPPYLVNYQGRDGRKVRNDDNARWLKPAFNQMHRVLKWGGFANAESVPNFFLKRVLMSSGCNPSGFRAIRLSLTSARQQPGSLFRQSA
jgi:hypothetical protein